MYLSRWQRVTIFDTIPCLYKDSNSTYYMKVNIVNPVITDFWNFFIRHKKLRYLTSMVKETHIDSLCSIYGDNALDTSLHFNYLPLFKQTLKKVSSDQLSIKDNNNHTIFDKIFNAKFSIYQAFLQHICHHDLEFLFSTDHMHLLINSNIDKMIYFEKIFPGLFLQLYKEKIDYLPPHFQYFLLQHNLLKAKLSKKLKTKNIKKILLKI